MMTTDGCRKTAAKSLEDHLSFDNGCAELLHRGNSEGGNHGFVLLPRPASLHLYESHQGAGFFRRGSFRVEKTTRNCRGGYERIAGVFEWSDDGASKRRRFGLGRLFEALQKCAPGNGGG